MVVFARVDNVAPRRGGEGGDILLTGAETGARESSEDPLPTVRYFYDLDLSPTPRPPYPPLYEGAHVCEWVGLKRLNRSGLKGLVGLSDGPLEGK